MHVPEAMALCTQAPTLCLQVLAYCTSSCDVCPLHWGPTPPPVGAEPQEQEYWGEEVESYFARWAEVGEALMAQECSRLKPVS